MNQSLLATMKIVAQMIAVDKIIHSYERSWFLALMNTFGASRLQRKLLLEFLRGDHKEELPSLIPLITEERDRATLLNLLTVAIHTDKVASPSEKEFYQHIKFLLYTKHPDLSDLYKGLGHELQKRDRSIQLWKELENLGHTLNARRYGYSLYPYQSFDSFLLLSWIGEISFTGKMKYLSFSILMAVILIFTLTAMAKV